MNFRITDDASLGLVTALTPVPAHGTKPQA